MNEDDKRNRAVLKARNRGKVAKEWIDSGKVLTKETEQEFRELMKKANKQFLSTTK